MFPDFYLNIELTHHNAVMPKRAIEYDAGLDLFCCEWTELPYNKLVNVPIGIKIEFPNGYVAIIKEKSSISMINVEIKAGVIDYGYRGEIVVLAKNTSKIVTPAFQPGRKIAQMLIIPVWTGDLTRVEKVNIDTIRKDGGFGSTGL